MNAHLPERFRGSVRSGSYEEVPLSPSQTLHAKVNNGIRAYADAADGIATRSVSGWLCQPEVPTRAEIILAGDGDVVLPANIIDGAWKSKTKYLKAHYSLLRDDAVSPLRDAVELFLQTPDMMESDHGSIGIYEKASLQ